MNRSGIGISDDNTDVSYEEAIQEFEYDLADVPDVSIDNFDTFYKNLREEFAADGEDVVVEEESARELFELIKAQQAAGQTVLSGDEEKIPLEDVSDQDLEQVKIPEDVFGTDAASSLDDAQSVEHLTDFDSRANMMLRELNAIQENMSNMMTTMGDMSPSLPDSHGHDELDQLLEGFPAHRVEKVREVFSMSLGNPSVLHIVPAVREVMPERISNSWLKKKNILDALAAMESAEADKSVDIHVLNAMLQVLSKSGSIDRTLMFYEKEFQAHDMVRGLIVFIDSIIHCH